MGGDGWYKKNQLPAERGVCWLLIRPQCGSSGRQHSALSTCCRSIMHIKAANKRQMLQQRCFQRWLLWDLISRTWVPNTILQKHRRIGEHQHIQEESKRASTLCWSLWREGKGHIHSFNIICPKALHGSQTQFCKSIEELGSTHTQEE